MNEALGIGIPAYILVGLIVAKWAMAGTSFEEKLEPEAGRIVEGHWTPRVILFFAGVCLWPVMLVLVLLGRNGNEK